MMQQDLTAHSQNDSQQSLPMAQTEPWHTYTDAAVLEIFHVEGTMGLGDEEVRVRLARYGPNRLSEDEREPLWKEFLEELREPMILLLLFTGVLYAVWGNLADTVTIFAVILFVIGIELYNEYRAKRAITALSKLAEPTTSVKRGGQAVEIPTDDVVPGDVILLHAGRRVPADGRLIEAYGLAIDESALTGESVSVEKEADLVLPQSTPLAERQNLTFAGTVVVRGRGTAIVAATAMQTEIGRIAGVAREVKAPRTPLQVAMGGLSRSLVWIALGFSLVVPLLALLFGSLSLQQAILTGLSLAFATIPEEMPIIITMVLALGAYRLSRQQAIVKRLQAVETLGSVTVIATDKTGTLTRNQMVVDRFFPEALDRKMLAVGALCNDATGTSKLVANDPLEAALLLAAREKGIDVEGLRRSCPLRDEFTFDTMRKLMSVVYKRDGMLWSAVKGAPEALLVRATSLATDTGERPLTEAEKQATLTMASQMAGAGLRVIAFAEKPLPDVRPTQAEAESGLTFIGLAGLADPPRPEARDAIAACHTAGIRPLMITGDHPLTARAIAQQIGLDTDGRVLTGPELDALSDETLGDVAEQVSLYARTTPEHKLRLVKALQASRERVAVTGDGINDAPAMAAADIGVAMGEKGTDVAREAAAMVLADDNFATIVHAIEEGRILFKNLQKGVRYYLACKVALVAVTLLPVLLRVPVPFSPVQIILMELFMDVAASAAFVSEPAEPSLMHHLPRDPREPFMNKAMVRSIFTSAAGLFAAVSLVYLVTWYSGAGLATAQTAAFVTWLLGHVFLALNLRSQREPLFRLGLFSNRLMGWWAAATVLFVLVVTFVPGVQMLFKTTSLSAGTWALAIAAALVGTFWIEVKKWVTSRR